MTNRLQAVLRAYANGLIDATTLELLVSPEDALAAINQAIRYCRFYDDLTRRDLPLLRTLRIFVRRYQRLRDYRGPLFIGEDEAPILEAFLNTYHSLHQLSHGESQV